MWWVDGELDYSQIRGGTGPLVYPAGFLYLFALLRHWTSEGTNLQSAQFIFLGFYLATQAVVMVLYREGVLKPLYPQKESNANRIWSWRLLLIVLCLSKRIHSIFMLRLFNDGPTMLLLYLSMLAMTKQKWNLGCFLFSLSVSIKMNVLLFAPGLLLLLLQTNKSIWRTAVQIFIFCAIPQFVLGYPFLSTYPISYIRKAFELDRVFMYKWTVNWKFLPEDVFLSKTASALLLFFHLGFLAIFATRWLKQARKHQLRDSFFIPKPLSPTYIIYTMFAANFVGICFARTLHYQFYVSVHSGSVIAFEYHALDLIAFSRQSWYFHSLPFLLYCNPRVPVLLVLLIVGVIESSFLTFPATPASSLALQICHFFILFSISPPPVIQQEKRD